MIQPSREQVSIFVPRALLGIFTVLGLYGLGDSLEWSIAIAAGVVAAVAVSRRLTAIVAKLIGAAIVATVTLLGFNVLMDSVGVDWPILAGLIVALGLHYLVAHLYLIDDEGPFRTHLAAGAGAAVVAIGFVVVAPILLGSSGAESKKVPAPQLLESRLDVLIVMGRPGGASADLPPDPGLRNLDVRYSVGFARDKQVEWTLIGSDDELEARAHISGGRDPLPDRTPLPRPEADTVLMLVVDGTPAAFDVPELLPNVPAQPREIGRWRRIARVAAPPDTPTYALLQTKDNRRVKAWRDIADPGGAVSVRALGSQTLTEAAARLAIASPTAREELALAMKHRPMLFFDRRETAPRPLSIATLFEQGRVQVCFDRRRTTQCDPPTRDPRQLVNGGTHLGLRLPPKEELRDAALSDLRAIGRPVAPPDGAPTAPPADDGDHSSDAPAAATPPGTPPPGAIPFDLRASRSTGLGTAMYVHPVAVEAGRRRLLYLDYWWYLPYNPANESGDGFCGAGLVIPGKTCFNHVSDWEGMTVVVDRTNRVPKVEAVHYAQHEHVVRYDFAQLRRMWTSDPQYKPFLDLIPDADVRPLAFSARGSHATYPHRCAGKSCRQVSAKTKEYSHDGGVEWVGNDTGACGRASCLQMLPTRRGGTLPALWNAFDGGWGEQNCVLTYYCDSGSPPKAPGQQDRYKDPTAYSGTAQPAGKGYDHR